MIMRFECKIAGPVTSLVFQLAQPSLIVKYWFSDLSLTECKLSPSGIPSHVA